jgi:hypothetical protein
MTIPSLMAALLLSLGAGTPPPIVIPGAGTAYPSRAQAQRLTLEALAGEWEGEFRVMNERGTSVSLVGLSALRETLPGEEADSVRMAFQGLAFATPIDGMSVLTLDAQSSEVSSTWYDTLLDTSTWYTGSSAAGTREGTLMLQSFTLESDEVLSQTITLESKDHVVIQITSRLPGQDARQVLSMDLYRLPPGQLSMGSGILQNPALLARLESMQTNTATANVNPDAE